MPSAKTHAVQTNFTGGEISPLAMGRFDVDKFANSLKRMENFLPHQIGGAFFRPGLKYAGEIKDSNARARLWPFQFNSQQAYHLEIGDRYCRFWADHGQVVIDASAPIDSYTKLLSHFDGANGDAFYTAETDQVFSFFGGAVIDTSVYAFSSGASLKLPAASSSYVTLPNTSDWDLGTAGAGDFTIEFKAKFISVGSNGLMGTFNGGATGWGIAYNSGLGVLRFFNGGNTYSSGAWTPVAGTLYHIEINRSGGTIKVYIDGTALTGSVTDDTWQSGGYDLQIGHVNGFGYGDVWIDEVRISKGTARHTANFTPPTAPYGGNAPAWVTTTGYVVGDYVTQSGTVYLCLIAHTSGTFATDLAAGKWTAQTALEIVTPWALADVPDVHFCYKADTIYAFHKDYPTQKIQRVSATEFTIDDAPFIRGPFLDANATTITITPSSATGATNLLASSAIFEAGHVGSLWRVKNAVVLITTFTDSTHVSGTVQAEPTGVAGDIGTTSATTDWAEGAFSDVRGYPRTGTFHGQRLVCAATTYEPLKFYATVIGAYDNFKTNASDESAAYIYEASADEMNSTRWIASSPGALLFGNSGGTISGSVLSGTITNANPPDIKADTNYGSLAVQPKRISSLLYYIQKNSFTVRELSYNYLAQRNFAIDMNLLAEHILRDGGGAYNIDYQQSPNDRIWAIRNDGQLAVLLRNPDQQITGWARIVAGVDSTTYGEFESVSIIRTDSGDDEVWVIVKRHINGTVKRFVEYFSPERFEDDWDSVNLDCALTLDSPMAITGATKANPVVITAPSHGRSNGDYVKIDNVVGMTELNGQTFKIKNKTTNTFELTDTSDVNIDGTGYSTYVSGGEVRQKVTSITGLSHLNGETVYVQADGVALSTTYTVSGGGITLASRAAVVHVGLRYQGYLQFLKMGDVNTQMKNRRYHLSQFRVFRSLGFKIGQDDSNLKEFVISTATGNDAEPNDGVLYTGDLEGLFASWWEKDTELLLTQDKPNPLFILCAGFDSDVIAKD